MNDFFQKWCCLVVLKTEESDQYINDVSASIGCNVHWMNSASDSELQVVFGELFNKGYRKVIWIDVRYRPEPELIKQAFLCLKMIECCIGPANDGTLYLFGTNEFFPGFFPMNTVKAIIREAGNLKIALYRFPMLQAVNVSVV